MARIRTPNEIILSLLDFLRTAQPNLDTKPGTVSRDLIIDAPATQLGRLYEELAGISNLQSLRLTNGADLDKISQNFGAVRQRGSKATGPILLTFSSLDIAIPLNKGDIITATNGATFVLQNSSTVSPVFESSFRATAARFRSDLDFVGITDGFAAEVLVEASSPGTQGNISKYAINKTTITNVNNVTNVFPFSGGRDTEDDATFRNRVFSIFSGANTGTALGYRNAVLADPSVLDAIVIEPGDTLMTRDGTQIFTAENGIVTILSEGTGGKIDVFILGTRLQEVLDSFIFRDLSNTGDTTNSDNDIILGQISDDVNKTVSQKRLDNIETGTLPSQPVNNIVQVTGTQSGSRFVEKQTDNLGRVTGNYEILKDTGAFAGSPWGFDKFSWIDDRIRDLEENKTKQLFNSQDPLGLTDLIEINTAQQNITVTNENSTISTSDRSSIQLAHFPVTNVTRAFNVTTGERYLISNQNPDGSGGTNATGRIIISGQTLPAISDILQVDYTWVFSFDPNWDFDSKATTTNPRAVQDSIDWGFSNAVRRERATLVASGSFLTVTVAHPISTVIDTKVFTEETGALNLSSGRVVFVAASTVTSVISIVRTSDGAELFNTSDDDGTFSGQTIFLPTDTLGAFAQAVTVVYNGIDVFNATIPGNFSGNQITITASADAVAGSIVEVNYISNISNLLPSTLFSELPALRNGNGFDTDSSTGIGTQPTTHILAPDASTIVQNLRQAPSAIGLNVTGSISSGVITVTGATLLSSVDVVFTASANSLKLDLSTVVRDLLGLSSAQSIPSTIRVAKLSKLEKVTTTTNLDVLSVVSTYDVRGYKLLDNNFVKEESVQDTSLTATEVELPATPDNTTNQPTIGDRLRATFYIATYSDSENVSFSRSGILHTQKIFAIIDSIAVSSGFISASSSSATLSAVNLNQPSTRTRYKVFYDYTAPKVNERITVRYNYDRLITDGTVSVESTRPISADVLVKSAVSILVDVTMNIVVTEAFVNNAETVRQNVQDTVTADLNTQSLGTIIDANDLVATAYTVDGVDRARIIFFNKAAEIGSVLSIVAKKNEFMQANTVTITPETR